MTFQGILGPHASMSASPNAVQIRVSINQVSPLIWRRIVVPLHWDLKDLHLAIQAAFNWWNYHLYEFRIGEKRYGDLEMWEDGSVEDVLDFHLDDFRDAETVFTYVYDFGDNWRHTLEIEEFLTFDKMPRQASCVAGARARPPEDVGGVEGYKDFLKIITRPKHPEHAATKRWCGGYFDPEWFDLKIVDKDVRAALKPNVRRRLYHPKPKSSSAKA